MSGRRNRRFYLWLVVLTTTAILIGCLVLSFDFGPRLWGCLSAITLVALGTAVSFPLLERSLDAGNVKFLQRYFQGMLLRVLVLLIGGVLVWRGTGWDLKHYLVSTALSYPLFLVFEAWTLSKMLGKRAGAVSPKRSGTN